MRIAMLHPSLTWRGGAERQLLRMAIELQGMGHEIEIFTNSVNDRCYPEMRDKLVVHELQHPLVKSLRRSKNSSTSNANSDFSLGQRGLTYRLRAPLRGYVSNFPNMLDMGRKIPKGFDLINNHNYPTEWAAFFAKKRLKVPVVWTCNEPPFWFTDENQKKGLGIINAPLFEGLDKVAVNYVDKIVVVSAIGRARVEQAYAKPSEIVNPGADFEFQNASGQETRLKYGLGNDFVLLSVGNIAADKRQSDSILALYYLSKKHKDVKLMLRGEGPLENLIELSRKLGVEDKILFLPACSDKELADAYAACDAFIFPAQITWGLVVIEAMAASKPVVVSKKCGVSEIITDGFNGLIFEASNPRDLALKVEELISDRSLGGAIGRHAHEYVVKYLSWKNYAKRMESIFRQVAFNN